MSTQLEDARREAWIPRWWRKLVAFLVAWDDAMNFSIQEQTERRLSKLEQDVAALRELQRGQQ